VINATERVERDVRGLRDAEAQLVTLTLLLQEMTRLNQLQQPGAPQLQPQPQPQPRAQLAQPGQGQQQDGATAGPQAPIAETFAQNGAVHQTPQGVAHQDGTRVLRPHIHSYPAPQPPMPAQLFPYNPQPHINPFPAARLGMPAVTRHGGVPLSTAIPAGSPDLPEGVVIPQGWSLLPLQRLDNRVAPQAGGVFPGTISVPRTARRSQSATRAPGSEVYGEFVLPGGRGLDDVASRAAVWSSTPPPPPTHAANPSPAAQESETNTAINSTMAGSPAPEQPRGRGENEAPDTEGGDQDPDVHVTAPIPTRLPNWGGAADLFNTIPSRHAASDTSGDQQDQQSLSQLQEGRASASTSSDPTTSILEEKGKAKAVTVEDGDSSSDDEI
jgi:E3 ubiquitin-protein ligase synoviolin